MPPAPLLGQASIVIDQATLPTPGVAGRSRKDGVLNEVVTLRNADNTGITKHQWVLQVPRTSTAVLSAPTSATTSFTPDIEGTYIVDLLVNEGTGKLQRQRRLFAVVAGAGLRYPGQGESNEANWTSTFTGNPNETGYWEDLDQLLRGIGGGIFNASVVTVDVEAGLPLSRQLVAGDGIAIDDNGPGTTIEIAVDFTAGVLAHDDIAVQPENLMANRAVQPATRDATKHGQVNLGSESVVARGTKHNYTTIAGGLNNLASAEAATIAGGALNAASASHAAVGGGTGNTASAGAATIAGGDTCQAAGAWSAVGGGQANNNQVRWGTIAGGHTNIIDAGEHGACGGGQNNRVAGEAATVAGGLGNEATDNYATISGGEANIADALHCVIGGGELNECYGNHGTLSGGLSCEVSGHFGTIGGGESNVVNFDHGAVGGGFSNSVDGVYGTIGGGRFNQVSGDRGCVAGGETNTAGSYAFIGGGDGHTASGAGSMVLGGTSCQAAGICSIAAGSASVALNDYAVAIGRGASAQNDGAAVLKDGQNSTISSSAANELTCSYGGGIRLLHSGGRLRHSGFSGANNYKEVVQGQQSTTDATPQTVDIFAIPTNQDVHIKGVLKGKRTTNDDAIVRYFEATYVNNAGAIVLVGITPLLDSVHTASLGSGYTATATISGTNLRLSFTGTAAHTIRWTWDFEFSVGGT